MNKFTHAYSATYWWPNKSLITSPYIFRSGEMAKFGIREHLRRKMALYRHLQHYNNVKRMGSFFRTLMKLGTRLRHAQTLTKDCGHHGARYTGSRPF